MKPDVIIVLGHESKRGKLSDLCKKRLEKAFKLYNKYKVPMIFTGGYLLFSKKFTGYTEASIRKMWLERTGWP